jgi:two-component system sensor histidine kinase HydH
MEQSIGRSGTKEPAQDSPQQTQTRLVWACVIGFVILLIEVALRFTPDALEHWHYALHRLYYLPIITAGLTFGWSGGAIAAVVSGISYLSHTRAPDSPDARNTLDRYLETLVFCLVGLLAGVLADRERRLRQHAEHTAKELRAVYRELQDNVEHVKRAARMSALGHLSAGLAHEIRNPLASIEGAATIVQNEPNSESRRSEFLEIIQKESRRLNRLLTNFLEFARPRAPELRPTDLGALIDSVVTLVGQTAARHQVIFHKDLSSDLRPLECDSGQLKQVLLNLALNAVQAMPKGGEVLVSASSTPTAAVIRVRDHGPGIAEEDVDSIYDPFFTTKPTGTGLGLPVAYQIVKQHGGELLLETNGPAGACFKVSIPYRNQDRS